MFARPDVQFRYVHLLGAIFIVSIIMIGVNFKHVNRSGRSYKHHSKAEMTALKDDQPPTRRSLSDDLPPTLGPPSTVKASDDLPSTLGAPSTVKASDDLPSTLGSTSTVESATTTEDPVKKMTRELPNVPLQYWDSVRANVNRLGWPDPNVCARLPWIDHIRFSNIYWQTLTTPNATYNFLNAYYDDRELNNGSSVRIISMITNPDPEKVYCQFWFDGEVKPVIVLSEEHYFMWHWGKQYQAFCHPYLITCRLPANITAVPKAVAVAANACDAVGNLLRVVYDPPPPDVGRKKFAVCVKGVDFPGVDMAPKLAEWLELVNALGADLVLLFILQVHPNVERVINHYASKGLVRIVPSTLPGGMPNYPLLQHEHLLRVWSSSVFNDVIELNDCFYRCIQTHEYVAMLDIDEVIMPLGEHRSWSDIVHAMDGENRTKAAFNTRNIYFFESYMEGKTMSQEIPSYMYFLQNVRRTGIFRAVGEATKSLFSTDMVVAVHNHYPLTCFGETGWCNNIEINVSIAQMAHYKVNCTTALGSQEDCDNYNSHVVNDTSTWRFKDKLIAGVQKALRATGLTYT